MTSRDVIYLPRVTISLVTLYTKDTQEISGTQLPYRCCERRIFVIRLNRSRTVEPLFPDLVIAGSVVKMVSELKILSVILDSKLTLEKQVRAIAASASRRVGILRKTMSVFRDVAVVAKCFWAFILPVLEYCFPVWMSAATSHLSLLDRVVSQVSRLSGGSVSCDLWHRRKVAS